MYRRVGLQSVQHPAEQPSFQRELRGSQESCTSSLESAPQPAGSRLSGPTIYISIQIHIYISIYLSLSLSLYIYIYMYIYMYVIHTSLSLSIYIYIEIYIFWNVSPLTGWLAGRLAGHSLSRGCCHRSDLETKLDFACAYLNVLRYTTNTLPTYAAIWLHPSPLFADWLAARHYNQISYICIYIYIYTYIV